MKERKPSSMARAVALTYSPDQDSAPMVSAKGSGLLAQKILDIARERDIPIRKDPDLIDLLASVDLMEEIPPALYTAIAEVLAFIYNVNEEQQQLVISTMDNDNAESNLHGRAGDDAPTDQT